MVSAVREGGVKSAVPEGEQTDKEDRDRSCESVRKQFPLNALVLNLVVVIYITVLLRSPSK